MPSPASPLSPARSPLNLNTSLEWFAENDAFIVRTDKTTKLLNPNNPQHAAEFRALAEKHPFEAKMQQLSFKLDKDGQSFHDKYERMRSKLASDSKDARETALREMSSAATQWTDTNWRSHIELVLANYYLGDAKDSKEAKKWLELASRHDHSEAQMTLAEICFAEKDYEKGKALLSRAAERGHPGAMHTLGMYLFEGKNGFKKNVAEAKRLWQKNQSHLPSQYNLAGLFLQGFPGDSIIQDVHKAIDLLEAGARWKHPRSLKTLYQIYSGEYGKEYKNSNQAGLYLRMCIENGVDILSKSAAAKSGHSLTPKKLNL